MNVHFHPYLPGEMIQFDEHIFQVGWFNHQLATTQPEKSLGGGESSGGFEGLFAWAGLGCLFRKNEELKGTMRLATCTWNILGLPYSLSSFKFSGILHVTHLAGFSLRGPPCVNWEWLF